MTTAGPVVAVVAFILLVGGTFALGIRALRRHDRQFPKGSVHFERKPGEQSSIETKTTWLSGGRG